MNDFFTIYEYVLDESDCAVSAQNVVAMPSADDLISIYDRVIDELNVAVSAQKDFTSGFQPVAKVSSSKAPKNYQEVLGEVALPINLVTHESL
jgi:hypothetical protein